MIKEKQKLAYDMTDEEVAKSIDLEISDFDESGDMLDELREIMEEAKLWHSTVQNIMQPSGQREGSTKLQASSVTKPE